MTRLALIHTASFLAPVFTDLCMDAMPDVDVFNIVDESLIQNTINQNALTPITSKRVARYVQSAEEAGADVVLVTCSSIGPAVEAARPFVGIPVLRVDEAMADQAVQTASTIGVIATLQTTLAPTTALVQARADQHGRNVTIISRLCEGAFEARSAGDNETHDRIVMESLRELMKEVEIVVLAQASMARVVDLIPENERTVPVLSSPALGVAATKQVIDSLA